MKLLRRHRKSSTLYHIKRDCFVYNVDQLLAGNGSYRDQKLEQRRWLISTLNQWDLCRIAFQTRFGLLISLLQAFQLLHNDTSLMASTIFMQLHAITFKKCFRPIVHLQILKETLFRCQCGPCRRQFLCVTTKSVEIHGKLPERQKNVMRLKQHVLSQECRISQKLLQI